MTIKELQGIIDQEVEKAKPYFDELEIQVHSTMELENGELEPFDNFYESALEESEETE